MDDKGLKEDAKGYFKNDGIHILVIGLADEDDKRRLLLSQSLVEEYLSEVRTTLPSNEKGFVTGNR